MLALLKNLVHSKNDDEKEDRLNKIAGTLAKGFADAYNRLNKEHNKVLTISDENNIRKILKASKQIVDIERACVEDLSKYTEFCKATKDVIAQRDYLTKLTIYRDVRKTISQFEERHHSYMVIFTDIDSLQNINEKLLNSENRTRLESRLGYDVPNEELKKEKSILESKILNGVKELGTSLRTTITTVGAQQRDIVSIVGDRNDILTELKQRYLNEYTNATKSLSLLQAFEVIQYDDIKNKKTLPSSLLAKSLELASEDSKPYLQIIDLKQNIQANGLSNS